MKNNYPPLAVRVWGEMACFTRPEMKVERVSYPVMTPSAARGILEAIFWRPQFRWRIEEIWVLKPIRYIGIVRNEVKSRASVHQARPFERLGGGYDTTRDRTQRHTLALRDVDYIIKAHIEVLEACADRCSKGGSKGEHPAKYRDQFRRRVKKGRCFQRPYLGCREFTAAFTKPNGSEQPINHTEDLGRVLFDIDYQPDETRIPIFFPARLEQGILSVPNLKEN